MKWVSRSTTSAYQQLQPAKRLDAGYRVLARDPATQQLGSRYPDGQKERGRSLSRTQAWARPARRGALEMPAEPDKPDEMYGRYGRGWKAKINGRSAHALLIWKEIEARRAATIHHHRTHPCSYIVGIHSRIAYALLAGVERLDRTWLNLYARFWRLIHCTVS
jgi:hypothetical protein